MIEQMRQLGIRPDARESYLSEGEFASVFGVSKEAFAKLPKWKRDALKKEKQLF